MFNITSIKGGLSVVDGFFCDGYSMGLKPNGGLDLGFIYSDSLCDISSVFTTNKFQAAPILHYKKYKKDFKTNFILLNSKNANAMTGKQGIKDIEELMKNLQNRFPTISNPIMSSTGVIGYRLNQEKFLNGFESFNLSSKNGDNLAKSIMTTDSFDKQIALEVTLEDGTKFSIAGVAKGAGMINPAMATMLCFIITDAAIPKSDMDELLQNNTQTTFNSISVDGDTSTNDTVMLLSNKKSSAYNKEAFNEALNMVMKHLSRLILKDGEGSNKVVAFEVNGAKTKDDAIKVSKALSNSLLVKTALFGEDPNWGRIASTIGASGIECDAEKLEIFYDDLLVYSSYDRNFTSEKEQKAFKIMKQDEYRIRCNLNLGEESFTSYGCDLSYEYVKINADYRT
jgi:glutamate N-acetyltransferase/amino-acid N-acetyltransferase